MRFHDVRRGQSESSLTHVRPLNRPVLVAGAGLVRFACESIANVIGSVIFGAHGDNDHDGYNENHVG